MPQMGESIAEGTIVRWIKKVGDSIDKDEPLFEISTDKVDAEIPSPGAGVLLEIMVKEGETVPVNTVVAVINGGAAKPAEESKPITPLLIEWNGDRFVRTNGLEPLLSNGLVRSQPSAKPESSPKAPKAGAPVTLIYRDGHHEQVRDYSIVAGRLYASADYVQSGSWMKTIDLSALDLRATIETNRASGIDFVLPTAPNVVVAHF
jgi:pyruvate/2-oxoglutarate dehydrogenase complex dihydrolipoamide acyltransferase (E2) component